uniref:(California timema) hypothetical protein n=1 Tax=Timema californicum TaxID=61474 RepID=A0A7R9J7S7_TIMCA|nr:unnamed protein product [Timema californicum]
MILELALRAHRCGSPSWKLSPKLVGFGPDQSPVSRLHLIWFPMGFNPTSNRLLRSRDTPLGGEIRIE